MNKTFVFLKSKSNKLLYFLSIIPLIIYGLYKNGYLLVSNGYLNTFDAYKIVLYPVICISLAIIFSIIFKKRCDQLLLFGIIMGIASPFNFNMFLYALVVAAFMFMVMFIPNKYKINEAALLITILIIINHFGKSISIFNPMELGSLYSYSLVDLFFGRGASYLFTSSIFLLIVSFIILSFIKTYKKNIPIISSCIFIFLSLIYMIFTHNYLDSMKLLLNGTTFFSFIYLATINESSPSTNKITYIYASLISVMSFIFIYVFDIYTGSIISVFICSLLYRLYTIFRQKMFLKNH